MTPDRTRVAFLIDGLGTGGSERSLAEMLPGLAERGIDAAVWCLDRRPEGVQQEVIDRGVDVRFLAARSLAGRVFGLRKLLARFRPHVLHTTLFDADVAGRLASLRTGVPVLTSLVVTAYDPVRLDDPNVKRWRLRVVQVVDSLTGRLNAHFHAVSHAVKTAAVRDLRIPADRITVVERGRDRARLGEPSPQRRAVVRDRLGVAASDEVVLAVGRQEFQKGQQTLLEASARLVRERPDVVVLIAGRRGHATATIERMHRELELGDTVRFLGHRDDVPDLLCAADVLVLPSLYEGSPGVGIEALALGTPVVASDIPAIRDVVPPGECGLLFPPGDAAELTATLGKLLDDPAFAARLGDAGRRRFDERYTIDRMTEEMAGLLRRVAGTQPR